VALSREAKARAFGAVLKDLEEQLSAVNVDRAKKRKRKAAEKAAPKPVEEEVDDTSDEED
jgi:hypothetical protein